MQVRRITGIMLVAALTCSTVAFAQVKQDLKNAGHETKDAAKDTGHGVKVGTEKGYHATKTGTKKSYHATKHATTKAYHKTATGTENVGRRLDDKKPVPNNPR
jgi:hypothetical protein